MPKRVSKLPEIRLANTELSEEFRHLLSGQPSVVTAEGTPANGIAARVMNHLLDGSQNADTVTIQTKKQQSQKRSSKPTIPPLRIDPVQQQNIKDLLARMRGVSPAESETSEEESKVNSDAKLDKILACLESIAGDVAALKAQLVVVNQAKVPAKSKTKKASKAKTKATAEAEAIEATRESAPVKAKPAAKTKRKSQ